MDPPSPPWTRQPPSPPSNSASALPITTTTATHPHSRPNLILSESALSLSALSLRLGPVLSSDPSSSQQQFNPAPLPTPSCSSPRPPTPGSASIPGRLGGSEGSTGHPPSSSSSGVGVMSSTTGPMNIPGNVNVNVGVLSPPTPAPSPTPRDRTWPGFNHEDEDQERDQGHGLGHGQDPRGQRVRMRRKNVNVDDDDDDGMSDVESALGSPRWKGKAKVMDDEDMRTDSEHVLNQFQTLDKHQRFAFLSALVQDLHLDEALVVSRNIEPRLRRDFMRKLPLELALYVLTFVNDAQTLGRAAQVSRYWYILLQDEQTWKDLWDRHRSATFQANPIANPRLPRRDGLLPPMVVSSADPPAENTRSRSGSGNGSGNRSRATTPTICTPSILDMANQGTLSRMKGTLKGAVSGIQPPTAPAIPPRTNRDVTFKQQFKNAYLTEANWLHGGRVVACHTSHDDGVVTSLAIDENFIVIGMANSHIHIFDAQMGTYRRSLFGHALGVWTLVLVSPYFATRKQAPQNTRKQTDPGLTSYIRPSKTRATYRDDGQSRRASFNGPTEAFGSTGAPTQSSSASAGGISRPNTALGFGAPSQGTTTSSSMYSGQTESTGTKKMRQSDVCGGARGWGNRRPLVVSGGCDRQVKVWDVLTGECVYSLRGHSSTIRCVKVLDGRPIAVSGSRDFTLRVWDIDRGVLLRTLSGHELSVRCIEIAGNKVASGSYDYTCRLWNVDTGECLQVLRGHYHQIYAVAYDGEKVVTGSLDSTVRVWSAATGECTALLQGHTSLVGQLQLSADHLVTGGSDGRVIIFDLSNNDCVHRLCAHDNSVTCLQFDDRFIVSGGNDGRVKLWNVRTGAFIRELTRPCDAVWRIAFKDDKCVVLCQRAGKTVLEVLSFRPGDALGGKKLR